MRIEAIAALLGQKTLPGTADELTVLATRIEELLRLNGEKWVVRHRRQLVREWTTIVERGLIRQSEKR